ncbi:MAG: type II toxin-antitoxin system PemK/MazF family toxin [Azospirillaceae bacterium]|nr:type II toxin-antitoxin system PemK/MazF family toxin [Azospirillaceae bacterium]
MALVCPLTSQRVDAPDFRISIEPRPDNGLRDRSQIMVDKPVTVRCERVGQIIGRLAPDEVVKLDTAVAFVMGLAD